LEGFSRNGNQQMETEMQMQVAGNKGYSINRPHMFAGGIMMLIFHIYICKIGTPQMQIAPPSVSRSWTIIIGAAANWQNVQTN